MGVAMYDKLVKQQIHDDLNNDLLVTLVDTISALFGNSIMVTTHIEGINVEFQEMHVMESLGRHTSYNV